MSTQVRFIIVAALVALAILGMSIGLAKNTAAMTAPAHLLLFLLVVALYLTPSALALHRNCVSTGWIVAINVLLGWTLFGWVVALGWAMSGKAGILPPAPPVRPVTGH